MRSAFVLALALACALGAATAASGQEAAPPAAAAPRPVRVGVTGFPPLVIPAEDRPAGFDVELWEAIAGDLELKTEYVVVDTLAALLAKVEAGEVDVALAGVTIDAKREERLDFSHQYLRSGLSILVPAASVTGSSASLSALFTTDAVPWLLGGLAFVLVSALLCWWSEQGNEESFADTFVPGYFEALYWTVVTMSTVGYGDYAPRRWLGRVVAVFVIFTGIGLFGTLVAKGASMLTISEMQQGSIQSAHDLRGRRVATVAGSTSADVLRTLGAKVVATPRIEEAYRALDDGAVEAVVYDWPTLNHYATGPGGDRVVLVGGRFAEQYYGVVFPDGSELREPVNRALLRLRASGAYQQLYAGTFGSPLG